MFSHALYFSFVLARVFIRKACQRRKGESFRTEHFGKILLVFENKHMRYGQAIKKWNVNSSFLFSENEVLSQAYA